MKNRSAFIRHLSDELCQEHNLSVIRAGNKRGEKYNEWQAEKSGSSIKTILRKDTDAAIKSAHAKNTRQNSNLFIPEEKLYKKVINRRKRK